MIDKDHVYGPGKLFIYEFGVLYKLTWPFLIYDSRITFAKKWDRRTGVFLKRWARVFKHADVGTLFRSRDFFGLQLTSPSLHFKKMQITKCRLLKHAIDPTIRSLYQHRVQRESTHTHQNLGSHFISKITPIVSHHLKYQGQHNRQGLVTDRYVKPHTFAEQ